MLNVVEIGNYYKLRLLRHIWKTETSFNVRVSGVTKKNSTEIFSEYDVKNELFLKYNIGLSTFFNLYYDSEVEVYICNEITNLSPMEFNSDESFFIPKNCVDMEYSEKLLSTNDLTFTISGINHYSEQYINIDNYIKEACEKLKNEIKSFKYFASPNLEITGTKTEVFRPESEVCEDSHIKESLYKSYENAKRDRKIYEDSIRNDYIESRFRCDKKYDEYDLAKKEIEAQMNNISIQMNANIKLNESLMKSKEKLVHVIEQLKVKGDQLNIYVPSLEELMEDANNIFGPSVTPGDE